MCIWNNWSQKQIAEVIEKMFPRSVSLRWKSKGVVTVHYFGRGKEDFCCIEGVWWKYVARDTGYWYHSEWDDEWVPDAEIDFLQRVDPPADTVYDKSVGVDYDNEPFVPTKGAVKKLLLCLLTYC
ncbi:MAG: hypothetical protein WAV50_03845 [Minisyncoccia bacterium]